MQREDESTAGAICRSACGNSLYDSGEHCPHGGAEAGRALRIAGQVGFAFRQVIEDV